MPSDSTTAPWENAVQWLREQPGQQQLVLDCYYDDPLVGAANRYWQSEEWAGIRDFLPINRGNALDVGAGRGIASYALAREGFAVTALEPDPSPIVGAEAIRSLAREAAINISVEQNFSERMPFADCQFDLVFARAVLHHTTDLAGACREFHRVLKPGGRLVAVREHVISRTEDLTAFFESHSLHKLYGGENAFLLDQYQNAVLGAGFTLRQTISPFDSAINYAPRTAKAVREELARRLPFARSAVARLLNLAPAWYVARLLLRRLDNRPGRLFSFIADKS